MSDVLVSVDNVSKKFCRSLKKSLWYGVQDMAGEMFGRSSERELRPDEFWAAKDISFELKRGECLGLIGRNGAGKTTLLKMLNGLIKPDKGRIKMLGRVGGLIELGAGFNPILSGRENIYVNASVLGLSKKEIDEKIDEIISFAEIGEFIDSPVQNYSSGMAVRLGFSIATSFSPDILLLDEVLAVGDAGFRAKCYSRMAAIRKESAVIFVSHSMEHLARLCSSSLLLSGGEVLFYGNTPLAISKYNEQFKFDTTTVRAGIGGVRLASIKFIDETGLVCDRLQYGSPASVEIVVVADIFIPSLVIDITFRTCSQEVAGECNNYVVSTPVSVLPGNQVVIKSEIREFCLNPNTYNVSVFLLDDDMVTHYDWCENITVVTTTGGRPATASYQIPATWVILPNEP